MEGITIDGKHTSEIGLELIEMIIPLPNVYENKISVPGMSGALDSTEVYGHVTYEERNGLRFVFTQNGTYEQSMLQQQELAQWVHGKKVKIVLDNDINYYYMARLQLETSKNNDVYTDIVLTGTADPFKYERYANNEDIPWDDVDFETTVFRDDIVDVVIDGEKIINIAAGQQPVNPRFFVVATDDLGVYFNGAFYQLETGIFIIPQIEVADKDVELKFVGKGKVTIEYRGAYL